MFIAVWIMWALAVAAIAYVLIKVIRKEGIGLFDIVVGSLGVIWVLKETFNLF